MSTFAEYVRCIVDHVPFAFSRWGDGEWSAILGRHGATCDGQTYTPQLRADLAAVLVDRPIYDLGLQSFARRQFGGEIEEWLDAQGLAPHWIDADIFARASIAGELGAFTGALAQRAVIVVGPAHLAGLTQLFPVIRQIVLPLRNCHDGIDRVLAETAASLLSLIEPVVLISAGPSAKVIVHRLYLHDRNVTLLDVGSLWEPYLGLCTRSYHQAVRDREARA